MIDMAVFQRKKAPLLMVFPTTVQLYFDVNGIRLGTTAQNYPGRSTIAVKVLNRAKVYFYIRKFTVASIPSILSSQPGIIPCLLNPT